MANPTESLFQRSQVSINGKFRCENQWTYFMSKKGKTERFLNGSLKIIAQVNDNCGEQGLYLMSASDRTRTEEVCMTMEALNDRKIFQRQLNAEFKSGHFSLGPNVSRTILIEYVSWLMDDFLLNGGNRVMEAVSHTGYLSEKRTWVLSNKVQLSFDGIVNKDQRQLYVLKDLMDRDSLEISTEMISDFNYFTDIFKSVVEKSSSFKENQTSFLLAVSFILKSYLNLYVEGHSQTSETRFAMLFSDVMNTGKTTSLYVLANGQGVPSKDGWMLLSGGDGHSSGTTKKPMREVLAGTNLFVFYNDYQSNKGVDEFMLVCHEGLNQGSGTSGVKALKAAFMLTANKEESARLASRVLRLNYCRSAEFSPEDRNKQENFLHLSAANKGFLVAWAYHFASLWFDEGTKDFAEYIYCVLSSHCPDSTTRFIKAWASTITIYFMIHYSIDIEPSRTTVIDSVIEQLNVKPGLDKALMSQFEKCLVEEFEEANTLDEIKSWFQLNRCFTNASGSEVSSVAICCQKLRSFTDINFSSFLSSLKSEFGDNVQQTIDFKTSTEKIAKRAIKIPECLFTSKENLVAVFDMFHMTYTNHYRCYHSESKLSYGEKTRILIKASTLKGNVSNFVRDRQGLPVGRRSEETLFIGSLSPRSKDVYLSKSFDGRRDFRQGHEACKRRRLIDVDEPEVSS